MMETFNLKFFYTTWNSHCKKELNTIQKLLILYPNINLIKINFDEDKENVDNYRIKGVPTVILENNSIIIGKVVGGGPVSYYEKIINNE